MQHIQVFCSQLEQLIQQLHAFHAVSEQMELQIVPTVDIAGVKSSLAEYQRAVRVQQPLTSSVLLSGQLLLRCIDHMSPFLRDTLQLIKSHCGALESRTQPLLCSILSAMESLSHQNTQTRVEEAASSLS
ncbi:centrosomal protein of 68 kDa-like [Notothenia coriiceps]|uniref:Centrosomal protein of 68 kDa-like n=1 Tax=Notothenia coriiceps TaxID=8208 RepID=A0A6I9N965_9TELE|nr:PREDICTED: centrosomal protein of 68 kDa-like [Notothenia coriiceps]